MLSLFAGASRPAAVFRLHPVCAACRGLFVATVTFASAGALAAETGADPSVTSQADAPASTDAPQQLDEVTVRANPLGHTADDLVQPVDVLSAAELARKRRSTIGETLENQPGVGTTDFGPGAGRPVIRGQAGPRVEVLENGIASMDASDVSTDHAVTIDPAHADQVEVIKGPATLLYGNGASAGVVNITDQRLPTEVTEGLHGNADAHYGTNGKEAAGTVDVGYGSGNHQLRGDFSNKHVNDYDIPGNSNVDGVSGSQGFMSNSTNELRSGSLSYGYVSGGNSAAVSVSKFNATYGLPVEETAYIVMHQTRYDAQGILDRPIDGLESIKLRAGYTDYGHTEFEAPNDPGTVFSNRQSSERIEAVHVPLAGWRGVFGLQNGQRDFSAVGDEAFVPPVVTRSTGVFLVEEKPYSLGKLELGARVERDAHSPTGNPDKDYTPLSLSAGSTFNIIDKDTHLKAYVQRAQRAPVAEELYAFGAHGATATFERGNPNLDLETATNFEIGLDHHGERLAWKANVYYERVKNYIYLQEQDANTNADGTTGGDANGAPDGQVDRVDETGNFVAPANYTGEELLLVNYKHGDAKFYGFEAQVSYAWLNEGPVKLSTMLFADSVRGQLTDGTNLPRVTPGRIGLAVDASSGPVSGTLSYARTQEQKHLAPLETPTSGYNLLTADVAYSFHLIPSVESASQVYVSGRNLLDADIRRATSFLKDVVPAPGRSVIVGMRIPF